MLGVQECCVSNVPALQQWQQAGLVGFSLEKECEYVVLMSEVCFVLLASMLLNEIPG
jgi:hypothetical protein